MARWRRPHARAGGAGGRSQRCCCCCCWHCLLRGARQALLPTSQRSVGAPSPRCRRRACSSPCWRATRPTHCQPHWVHWNGCSTRGSARRCGECCTAVSGRPAAAQSAAPRLVLLTVLAPARADRTCECLLLVPIVRARPTRALFLLFFLPMPRIRMGRTLADPGPHPGQTLLSNPLNSIGAHTGSKEGQPGAPARALPGPAVYSR